jgi:hypothetical protein
MELKLLLDSQFRVFSCCLLGSELWLGWSGDRSWLWCGWGLGCGLGVLLILVWSGRFCDNAVGSRCVLGMIGDQQ